MANNICIWLVRSSEKEIVGRGFTSDDAVQQALTAKDGYVVLDIDSQHAWYPTTSKDANYCKLAKLEQYWLDVNIPSGDDDPFALKGDPIVLGTPLED